MARPDLTDVTDAMSMIYRERGDLSKAFTFAFLGALEIRNDSEKWRYCAELATRLSRPTQAIYCYNRAVKVLDPRVHYLEIFALKKQKIDIYKKQSDWVSISRTLDKLITFFS